MTTEFGAQQRVAPAPRVQRKLTIAKAMAKPVSKGKPAMKGKPASRRR